MGKSIVPGGGFNFTTAKMCPRNIVDLRVTRSFSIFDCICCAHFGSCLLLYFWLLSLVFVIEAVWVPARKEVGEMCPNGAIGVSIWE